MDRERKKECVHLLEIDRQTNRMREKSKVEKECLMRKGTLWNIIRRKITPDLTR